MLLIAPNILSPSWSLSPLRAFWAAGLSVTVAAGGGAAGAAAGGAAAGVAPAAAPGAVAGSGEERVFDPTEPTDMVRSLVQHATSRVFTGKGTPFRWPQSIPGT